MSDTAFADALALPFTDSPSTEISVEASTETRCEQCGEPFTPRVRSGGKPQRFCKPECRAAFHAQRGQREPTCNTPATDPALILADTLNAIEAARTREQEADAQPDAFGWDSPDDQDDIVIHRQPTTACYWNRHGSLVIRQEGDRGEDAFLFFDPSNLPKLIHRLTTEYESWKHDRA